MLCGSAVGQSDIWGSRSMEKYNSKKAVAQILAAAMVFSAAAYLPSENAGAFSVSAYAADEAAVKESISVNDSSLPDNDELFAMYVNELMHSGSPVSASAFEGFFGIPAVYSSNYGEKALSGGALKAYKAIKEAAAEIASGNRASTIVYVSMSGSEWNDLLAQQKNLLPALINDCPSELYWFDKTVGWNANKYGESVTITMNVANAYKGSGEYTVNTSKIKSVQKAITTAKSVANSCSGKTDYEKMVAFKTYICNAVEYNDAALAKGTPYGDPWQLIYVFDGDSSTNVVCEGYSKAFQYLCELSGIECHSVLGTGDLEAHMWNIVKLDGAYYHVDITWTDTAKTEAYFLKGATPVTAGESYNINGSIYKYDPTETALYKGTGILYISSSDYTPGAHTHSFSDEWTTDKNYHWHECSGCDEKDSYGEHIKDSGTITNPATAVSTGVKTYCCETCGCEMETEVIPKLTETHTHTFAKSWTSDEYDHWHECTYSGCTEVSDKAAHIIDGGKVTKPATETEPGIKTYYCSVCGTEMGTETIPSEMDSHTHTYDDVWTTTSTFHMHICTFKNCTQSQPGSFGRHSIDEGTVTVAPTTTSTGVKVYKCKICGYEMGKMIIPAISEEHTHEYSTDLKFDDANHWHECICGDRKDIAPHNIVKTVVKEATLTETGLISYVCGECGYIEKTETIDVIPHDHAYDENVWLSNRYSHWHRCTLCGGIVDSAAHVSDEGVVTKEPTETSTGIKVYSCKVCGYVIRTDIISKTGSDPVDPDPTPTPTPTPAPTYNYTPSYSSSSTSSAAPSVKEPSIVGEDGAKGWDAIIDSLKKTDDEGQVTVDMNSLLMLPKNVLNAIKGNDVDIIVKMTNKISWKINGKSVDDPKSVNLSVKLNSNRIPDEVLETVSNGSVIQLSLSHSGKFGYYPELIINVGTRYNNKYATLYYYNPAEKAMEFVDSCMVESGNASFMMSHASDYAIVFTDEPMYEDVDSSYGTELSAEDVSSNVSVYAAAGAVAAAALALLAFRKRARK